MNAAFTSYKAGADWYQKSQQRHRSCRSAPGRPPGRAATSERPGWPGTAVITPWRFNRDLSPELMMFGAYDTVLSVF